MLFREIERCYGVIPPFLVFLIFPCYQAGEAHPNKVKGVFFWVLGIAVLFQGCVKEGSDALKVDLEEVEARLKELPLLVSSGEVMGAHSGFQKPQSDIWYEMTFPRAEKVDAIALFGEVMEANKVLGTPGALRFYGRETKSRSEEWQFLGSVKPEYGRNYPCWLEIEEEDKKREWQMLRMVVTNEKQDQALAAIVHEWIVFSGDENLASQAEVRTIFHQEALPRWSVDYLNDGRVNLLRYGNRKEGKSLGFHSDVKNRSADARKGFVLSVPAPEEVHGIYLHSALPDNFAMIPSFGFPEKLKIIMKHQGEVVEEYEVAPLFRDVMGKEGLYLPMSGLLADEIEVISEVLWRRNYAKGRHGYIMALDEVEVIGGDGARGFREADIRVIDEVRENNWGKEGLLDGVVHGHELLPLRAWVEGLDERGRLEAEKQALERRYDQALAQEKLLRSRWVSLLGVLGVMGAFLMWWLWRSSKAQTRERERKRLAQDLHDDLGAQLSSMKLVLSSVKDAPSSSRLRELMDGAMLSLNRVVRSRKEQVLKVRKWKGEVEALCELLLKDVGYDLMWRSEGLSSKAEVSGALARQLELLLRELIQNKIKHAGPGKVSIALEWVLLGQAGERSLEMKVCREGERCEEKLLAIQPASALARAKALRGELRIHLDDEGRECTEFKMPWR